MVVDGGRYVGRVPALRHPRNEPGETTRRLNPRPGIDRVGTVPAPRRPQGVQAVEKPPAQTAAPVNRHRNANADPVRAYTPGTRLDRVQVGDRLRGGQLSATVRTNERGERITVTAAELTGLQVDISKADAREFALGILSLIDD